jgi:endonuclease/exonuclease/phosphatase family metal-dependent hydrolase
MTDNPHRAAPPPVSGDCEEKGVTSGNAVRVDIDGPRGPVTVVCGNFTAVPDCDETRLLTGRAAGAGTCWHDAWEFAAAAVFPRDRRIDYVFSTWFHRGGAGQPLSAEIIGTAAAGATAPSDHYGVPAELRY